MPITSLEIVQFRNLDQVRLDCSPRLNLITGENASGKTSLLEAIYFLGRTRSFRTRYPTRLIQQDQRFFRVVATLDAPEGQPPGRVGVERHHRELIVRVDGAPASNLALLAQRVPVLLLTPDSHRLLEDGPRQRRRFMDWGCFHREAEFLPTWQRFRTALRQRNAALRNNGNTRAIGVWDRELAGTGVALDCFRQRFCGALEAVLGPVLEAILGICGVTIDYQRGWSPDETLETVLSTGLEQDRRQGFTRLGPHRATFQVRVDGRDLEIRLSRGQQKLLVIGLILAQARLFHEYRQQSCMLLIDDLPAELDASHRQKVMDYLAGLDIQLFITAIEAGLLSLADWPTARRFRLGAGSAEVI